MRPSFHPRLVNGPFDDPVVYVPFLFENRAILFDLGEIRSLSARDILKVSHIFVSHTHMDHFTGFDRVLRLFLGREKTLYLYGPEGFLKNVEGKLAGYCWNLVEHYSHSFALQVTEVRADVRMTRRYPCRNKFIPDAETLSQPFTGVLHQEPSLTISAAVLDHNLPCLGFSLKEEFHINILKDKVAELGLEVGPWLKRFKQALFNRENPESVFEIGEGKTFVLGELAEKVAMFTPGQRIAYITDVIYSPSNLSKILTLADNADHLFIEASFLEKDRDISSEKFHLTACQAGSIAAMAKAKQFTPFHFSPRYFGMGHLLEQEARAAYEAGIGIS